MSNTIAAHPMPLTNEIIDAWTSDGAEAVALHLKQKLFPVEGDGGVIFPPTYADIGYNIDTLSDGTKVATIDSVGSQANRMEPLFKREPFSKLVPQIEIELHAKSDSRGNQFERRSILDLAHRAADAVVYASPSLKQLIEPAFRDLRQHGDAGLLCRIAPTSLVFGVWDSRGESGEKRPRLIRSMIRAWQVEQLFAAAQFTSIWKELDETQQKELTAEAGAKKAKLSAKGFADAPATFRKVGKDAARGMPEYRNNSPNPARRVLGGIIARGPIERDITINLVALRAISGTIDRTRGTIDEDSMTIRRYLLSLALVAATTDDDLYLREGCHLRYAGNEDWNQVPRRGAPTSVDMSSPAALQTIFKYAETQAGNFADLWPQGGELIHRFSIKDAKKLLAKKEDEEESSE
jgi:CRISPR-associated protein Csb1